ncbi:unnamed protein product [Gongylonema pulchrum]|uniref:C-type lectin domain-containing protein n=1 Tax=Gongylonema pulchrum TaxID=637853 RepID=A0A183D0P5_9BILA|nr:unnamed protein product [Gongylonema pulchrum]
MQKAGKHVSAAPCCSITQHPHPNRCPFCCMPEKTKAWPTCAQTVAFSLISLNAAQLKLFWFFEGIYAEKLHGRKSEPFWIGVRKVGYKWMMPAEDKPFGYTPVTFTNWGPSQPDGCCSHDVTCVVVNRWGNKGEWDDQGCNSYVGNAGAICQKKGL